MQKEVFLNSMPGGLELLVETYSGIWDGTVKPKWG